MNESYVDPTRKYPIDPMWEVTSKYYSLWEEYHKVKEELADTKCKLGQMDDYVNEVLKLELAETKLKLKMAQSAWDELDKSHASRAKLHDELMIAEGQRDQAKMRANRADDYINETLKPQLADAKKSAQIAWDELDIFRITNAKLHDELIITEGQRDQARAERDAAEVERGVDTGSDCAVCTTRIYGKMLGAGDGTGQKFAHTECYYRTRLDVAEAERDALRTMLQMYNLGGYTDSVAIMTRALAAETDRDTLLKVYEAAEDFIGAQGTAYENDQYLMLCGVLGAYNQQRGTHES